MVCDALTKIPKDSTSASDGPTLSKHKVMVEDEKMRVNALLSGKLAMIPKLTANPICTNLTPGVL